MLVTLASFALVLGVLIFVHELGHFIAAKLMGIGVPRFSIGFGPPTPLRFTRGETEYVLSWFPVGGYVKMASREEQEAMGAIEGGETAEDYPPDKLFENKSLPARILVISAGVVMNALFAWMAYTGLAVAFGRTEDPTTRIARVDAATLPDAAARLADLPTGTQIVRINGDTMRSWERIRQAIIDPTSDRLRFDFAGEIDPVIVEITGMRMRARIAIDAALKPLWPAKIGLIGPGLPADKAGIEPGDVIVGINGDTVRMWEDIKQPIERSVGDTLRVLVQRADSVFALAVVPEARDLVDPVSGETRTTGWIGVGPELEILRIEYGPLSAIAVGAKDTWDQLRLVFATIGGMFAGSVSLRELGGPILIAQVSGQAAQLGGAALLSFMAFLSVNLAVVNLLPIPVLDGGHLVFLILEGIRGKPLSLKWRLRLTQVGMFVLMAILVLVFGNDILRMR